MKTKLTKLVSPFYHFPAKSSTLNHFQTEQTKHTKTLTNSKETYEKVAPLETILHKESKKIWFGIFREIHK